MTDPGSVLLEAGDLEGEKMTLLYTHCSNGGFILDIICIKRFQIMRSVRVDAPDESLPIVVDRSLASLERDCGQ